jgi:hypothetical protein
MISVSQCMRMFTEGLQFDPGLNQVFCFQIFASIKINYLAIIYLFTSLLFEILLISLFFAACLLLLNLAVASKSQHMLACRLMATPAMSSVEED